jgi:hypothetical protein
MHIRGKDLDKPLSKVVSFFAGLAQINIRH